MADQLSLLVEEILNLPTGSVTDETSADNTPSWDSFALTELINGIEEKYSISFDFDELLMFTSVGEIRKILIRKGAVR